MSKMVGFGFERTKQFDARWKIVNCRFSGGNSESKRNNLNTMAATKVK
jgi:hypothetical protein